MSENPKTEVTTFWSKVLTSTRSPLHFFTVVALICNAVFALSAAWMADAESFKYTIHMFLGIVMAFVLIAIWSPRSLYHPKELIELYKFQKENNDNNEILPAHNPKTITWVLLSGTVLYALYQLTDTGLNCIG